MLTYYLSLVESLEEKNKVEEIYHHYKKLIKYLAFSKLQNEHLAEEVVHEVMLAVIAHIKKLQNMKMDEMKGFIYIATRNISVDVWRKENRRAAENVDEFRSYLHSEDDPQANLGVKVIAQYIADMPSIYREVLELTVYYGMTYKECAKLLKISQATVRKRLERARAILRDALKESEEQYV